MSKKRISLSIIVAALIVFGLFIHKQNGRAQIGVGYKTKVTCSEVFVAGRKFEDVVSNDFFNIDPMMDKVSLKIDRTAKAVTGSLLGLGKSHAVYREGVGCTVFASDGVSPVDVPIVTAAQRASAHKYGLAIDANVQTAVRALFDDKALAHPIVSRGVVVIQNGEIVGEHYAEGFDRTTHQQSWSMAKGINQSLVGILTGRGLLSLDDKNLLDVWQKGDPRGDITLGHLLQMASGLTFLEEYGNTNSDVTQMLFNAKDMAAYAANLPLKYKPGEKSVYGSGTANIVAKVIRNALEEAGLNPHAFPRRALFDKIDMTSAIFEVDPSGTFIGSSYVYATARDYARFGQLYLQDGVWEGERILPENWVVYTGKSAVGRADYGSTWSLNLDGKILPGMPKDVIFLGGNDGQYIFVIPSKNAVIVRLGITRMPASFDGDLFPLIRGVYNEL